MKRALAAIFFAGLAYFLLTKALAINWKSVEASVREYRVHTLLLALFLTALSYTLYSQFDVLSKHQVQHHVSRLKSSLAGFLSYAFNLNLGSIVGSIAFRFRIYSRFGVDRGTTARIIGFSIFSNWAGYIFLTGFILSFLPPDLPEGWNIPVALIRAVGVALLIADAAYVLMCRFSPIRRLTVFERDFELPSPRMALAQIGLGVCSWSSIATVLWVLFRGQLSFPEVLSVFLISGMISIASHIPAGIGITEAVFIKFFSDRLSEARVLAALLAFRAIFYIVPLIVAGSIYLFIELKAKRSSIRMSGLATGSS